MKTELRLDQYCMALLGIPVGSEEQGIFLYKRSIDPYINAMFELIKKLVVDKLPLEWKDE